MRKYPGTDGHRSRRGGLRRRGADRRALGAAVTLPSDSAEDSDIIARLAELGIEAVRINCARDDDGAWARMIAQVDKAASRTGRRMKVFMDLAGPTIRTGVFREGKV